MIIKCFKHNKPLLQVGLPLTSNLSIYHNEEPSKMQLLLLFFLVSDAF
ncbi:hypothetical protein D922_04290 [Enterococcus faecalis 06-MB-DW-09]|nr:hypothetical protein D931_02504 [Enterococcus faecium 13.SD.W.09]EPH87362.1 hypothetical protein D922_04290 [Enterococcus faecalis 06-MB-DW-09]